MGTVSRFLQSNSIDPIETLPLTHVTQAYHARAIAKSDSITTTECSVFKGEKLNYFFVGRPSYKKPIDANAMFFELPMCFIMDFGSICGMKRAFPFDSGGHQRKFLPNHTTTLPLEEFEIVPTQNNIERLMGAFFASRSAYFALRGRSEQEFKARFDVDPLDAEVFALHRLSQFSNPDADDRSFCIEIQCDQNQPLRSGGVLAVIAPSEYGESSYFTSKVEGEWGAELLTYDTFPVNKNYYHASIYNIVKLYLDENNLI